MSRETKILQFARTVAGLSRPGLSAGITLSAITGYIIAKPAPGADLILVLSGVFLISAGSSALNQYTERSYDAVMKRTAGRPIPTGRISPSGALEIAAFLVTVGIIFLLFTGFIPAVLSVINILLYNVLYTNLKRKTTLALLPGALVGAVPPLIGFSAAGSGTSTESIIYFSFFMFLWQLPHFWLIAIKYEEDYRLAGYKFTMYPVSSRNKRILVFCWIAVSSALLAIIPAAGLIFQEQMRYLLLLLNALFIYLFYRSLFSENTGMLSLPSFALINSFGVIVMLILIVNSLISGN